MCDIASLGAETRPCLLDDGEVQPQALGDVDSRRGSRDADFQFISGLQSGFVEANGCVEHSWRVDGENFQRCVMGRDDGDTPDRAKVLGDGDRESCAFFGIGSRAELVQKDE